MTIKIQCHAIRKVKTPLALGLVTTLFLLLLSFVDLFGANDYGAKKSLDLLSKSFPYEKLYPDNSASLALIAIDDESLQRLGQWPWPRKTVAKIIDNINKSGVAVLGVDVLFLEEDRYSPRKLAAEIHMPLSQLEALGFSNGDIQLGEAMANSRSVLAFALGRDKMDQINGKGNVMPNRFIVVNDAAKYLISAPSLLMPQKTITKGTGFGFVNASKEGGLVREVPMAAIYGDMLVPSLSLDMLRAAQGVSNFIVKPSDSGHALNIKVGNYLVQTGLEGQLLYHHGQSSRFEQVPAYRLYDGVVDNLQGRIAVFGVNALALGDRHTSIIEESVPGPLMHLQALDQILSGRFIMTHPGFDRMIYLICALIAGLICYLIVHVPLIYTLAIGGISFLMLLGVTTYSFIQFGFVFNFFTSLAILLTGGFFTYFLQSLHEERLRKKMQSSFAQYVPSDVVERISRSGKAPALGGEMIEASVLFLDLRGFTSLTELLKPYPELMVQVIGTIMEEITVRLIESGATIDKYIGDAVMAFWNAPEKQDNHLVRALYGACRIQEDLDLIKSKIYSINPIVKEIKIAFGIGICCGPITIGNFGSSFRFNYTALGDAVNIASRLEVLTKDKGWPILVAANSLKDGEQFIFNDRLIQVHLIGTTEIRGKVEVIEIFTVEFI